MVVRGGAYGSDPFVDKKCPGCDAPWPEFRVEGTGEEAVRCSACGAAASTFAFEEGYTIAFDEERSVGLTVDADLAHRYALDARTVAALPATSEQVPILAYEPHSIPGTLARLRSFIGNIGTTPSADMPDSHNAGDFGASLVGSGHRYELCRGRSSQSTARTGTWTATAVREGAVLIVPVKVAGGGIYMGDAHANQGDGELSLHTTDITADIEVQVDVLKRLTIDGPVLLPVTEDLPWIARPFTASELKRGRALGHSLGVEVREQVAPVQFIGTAASINEAADNAIDRASSVLGMSRARSTTGRRSAAASRLRACRERSSSRCLRRSSGSTAPASGTWSGGNTSCPSDVAVRDHPAARRRRDRPRAQLARSTRPGQRDGRQPTARKCSRRRPAPRALPPGFATKGRCEWW